MLVVVDVDVGEQEINLIHRSEELVQALRGVVHIQQLTGLVVEDDVGVDFLDDGRRSGRRNRVRRLDSARLDVGVQTLEVYACADER